MPHPRHKPHPTGFTVIELAVVVVLIGVAVAMGLAVLAGHAERSGRQARNAANLRTTHQSMVTWSQSNQRGGNDGYYPGLDTSGNVVPNGPLTGYSGDGTQPAARLWMLLNGGFLAPEDLASPLDTHHAELAVPPGGPIPPVTHEHFSYALQSLAGHPGERDEWKQTLNTATVVMGDRAIGTGPADISSDWTEQGSGDWRGAVVRNDNSTAFETRPALNNTRYGQHPSQSLDNLFEDEPAHADAYLVHDDATTSHSKD